MNSVVESTGKPQRSAGSSAQGADQLISITQVLKIIRRHWLVGLFFGLLVGAAVFMALMQMPAVYRAKSSILIDLGNQNIMDVRGVLDSNVKNQNLLVSFMNTHIERLKSRAIAEKVFDALDPDIQRAFYEGYVGPLDEYHEELPNASSLLVKNALEVTWGTESQAIWIEISHLDPKVAQEVANMYIKQYMRFKVNLREQSTSGAVSFLGEQIKEIREELEASEQELQDFRIKHSLVRLDEGEGIVSQKMAQINQAVTEARIRLLSVESRIKQIKGAGEDLDQLMSISFVGGRKEVKEIYAQLQELRRAYKVLNGVYLSRHPLIVENKASHESVLNALWQAIDQARNEVAFEYKTTEGELESLEERLMAVEKESLTIEGHLIEYREIERNVELMRETYEMLSTRYTQTNIAKRMNLSNVRVLDYATKPSTPAWPDTKKIALASIFLAGIFFVSVPLGLEFFDTRIKSFSDIEHYANTQLLGDIRYYRKKSEEDLGNAVINCDEDFIEQFRAIYGGIRLKMNFGEKPIKLIVTSSEPGEGKSFVAANLAATFAAHKFQVLIMDCDLRRPTLHGFFGLDNTSGVLKWLDDSKVSIDCQDPTSPTSLAILDIREIAPNLSLLCTGGSSEHATEVFGDQRFQDLMEALHSCYDVIIFDTPPVGLFPDATLMADYASGTVFVSRQHQVTKQKVRYAVNLMGRTSAPVIGAVFNGIKDIHSVVGYGDFDGSYYGYGYNKDTTRYQEYYKKKDKRGRSR